MKNSIDTVGNRTRDLLACSAVPQPICATACPSVGYVSEQPVVVINQKNVVAFPYLYFRTVHVIIFLLFKPTHALFLKHIHIHI